MLAREMSGAICMQACMHASAIIYKETRTCMQYGNSEMANSKDIHMLTCMHVKRDTAKLANYEFKYGL